MRKCDHASRFLISEVPMALSPYAIEHVLENSKSDTRLKCDGAAGVGAV